MTDYRFREDIELISELLRMPLQELAKEVGVNGVTLSRWKSGTVHPSPQNLAALYEFTYRHGVRLNEIKAQLHRELLEANGQTVVFHGAKNAIDGPIRLDKSRPDNDFGKGFYCGENLIQSAMFVSHFPTSSVYIVGFDPSGLTPQRFKVDQEWMLAIAWFRGKLKEYSGHPAIQRIIEKVESADYIVAPIADNRMFEIIDTFIDGEITDKQCQHCLSATNLGNQFVFRSEASIGNLEIRERCYLSETEKRSYQSSRQKDNRIGADKVKIARRQFRGQGLYIDEVLS